MGHRSHWPAKKEKKKKKKCIRLFNSSAGRTHSVSRFIQMALYSQTVKMQWETLKFSRLRLKHSAYAFMNGTEWNILIKWRWMDQILSTPLFVVCALLSNVRVKRRHACRSQAPSLSHETHFTPHSVVVQRNSRELSYLISKCKHDSQSQKCQSSLKEFNYSTNK